LERHINSVKVALFDTDVVGVPGSSYQGININPYGLDVDVPFIFNPEGKSANVTDLWAYCIYISETNSYNLEINGAIAATLSLPHSGQPYPFSIHIQDTNVYATIKPGINNFTLTTSDAQSWFILQELSLYIEYEYLA
jgi:hypothetical protein